MEKLVLRAKDELVLFLEACGVRDLEMGYLI